MGFSGGAKLDSRWTSHRGLLQAKLRVVYGSTGDVRVQKEMMTKRWYDRQRLLQKKIRKLDDISVVNPKIRLIARRCIEKTWIPNAEFQRRQIDRRISVTRDIEFIACVFWLYIYCEIISSVRKKRSTARGTSLEFLIRTNIWISELSTKNHDEMYDYSTWKICNMECRLKSTAGSNPGRELWKKNYILIQTSSCAASSSIHAIQDTTIQWFFCSFWFISNTLSVIISEH